MAKARSKNKYKAGREMRRVLPICDENTSERKGRLRNKCGVREGHLLPALIRQGCGKHGAGEGRGPGRRAGQPAAARPGRRFKGQQETGRRGRSAQGSKTQALARSQKG
jgi:hypothetical protein